VDRNQLLNGRLSRFVTPASQPVFRAFLKRIFAGTGQEVCDLALVKQDAPNFWARFRGAVAISDRDAKKWCRVSVADITAFQHADETRARLAAIVESSDDAIISKDLHGIITSWNRGAERLYGYTEAEAVGQSVTMLMPADLRVEETPILEIIRRGEAVSHYETKRRRKDGTSVEISLTVSPLKNARGEVVGASKIARDITERKQRENALRRTEEDLRDFVEHASVGMHWVGPDGIILWANRAELEMLGYTREEYIGHHIAEFHADPPVIEDILQRLTRRETLHECAARLRCKDGSIREVLINSNVLWDGDEFIHTRCFTRDVTERKQAERKLQDSERRLRDLVEALPAAIYTTDAAGRITMFNQAAVEFSGRMPELGTNSWCVSWKLYSPDGTPLPHDQCPMAIALKEDRPLRGCEAIAQRPDGRRINFIPYPTPLHDSSGKLVGAVNMLVDITARKQMEEALRESQERFHTMADAMPQLAWMAQPDGFITWYNQGWHEYTGTTPKEMEGWGWQSVHDPEVLPQVLERWKASIATGEPFEMTFPLRGADGVFRPFLTRVQPQKDKQGRVLQWFGTNTDVDELKRVEQALRESENRKSAILNGALDAIITMDHEGKISDFNPAAEKIFGYRREEALGKPLAELIIPERLRQRHHEGLARYLVTGEGPVLGQRIEMPALHAEGREFPVELSISRIADLQPPMFTATLRDITERRQMEQELHTTNHQLLSSSEKLQTQNVELAAMTEELHLNNVHLEARVVDRTARLRALAAELTESEERERRRIAQILHDDLQQLLVGATVHLEILRKQKDPRSRLEALRRVEQLIQESNDVARGLSHELSPIALQQGDLGGALKWLAGWMDQSHRLTVCVEGEAVAAPVEDSVKVLLFQSVRELLFNVVKHAGVKRAKVRMTETREGQLEILVSDLGKGFDAPRTTTGQETSGGLGLFSIRERLHLLGGRMEVQSASGCGSQFRLLAPLQKPPQSNAAPKLPLPAPRAKARPSAASGARPSQSLIRVVLADDHKVMRDGLAALLAQQPGVAVVGVAANGQEAIKQARKFQPDLVVMDLDMPRMDGIQATRAIKAALPGIKVIGLTLHADALRHDAMLQAGAVQCLNKTILSRNLLKTINAAFAATSTRSGKPVAKKRVSTRAKQV